MSDEIVPWKNFISGGVGGIGVVASGHPLDTIKVNLQSGHVMDGVRPSFLATVRSLHAHEGLRGFYKGMGAPLALVTPIMAMSFWGYSIGKKPFHRSGREMTYAEYFAAGAFSGVATLPVVVPVDRVKCLLQIQGQNKQYSGPLQCLSEIVKREGVATMYRGLWATIWRDVPGSGLFYVCYEYLVRTLPSFSDKPKDPFRVFLAGGLAGVIFWNYGIIPDVIKTRHQTAPAGKYRSLRHVVSDTITKGGLGGLFAGLTPVMIRSFIVNGVFFILAEKTIKILNKLSP